MTSGDSEKVKPAAKAKSGRKPTSRQLESYQRALDAKVRTHVNNIGLA